MNLPNRFRWMAAVLLALGFLVSAGQAVAKDANDVVMDAIDATLGALRADPDRASDDPEFVVETLTTHILPVIDTRGMGQLILARHWRDASPEQRDRFVTALAQTLMRTYGVQLGDYIDNDVTLIERRSRQDERQAVVAVEIELEGQSNLIVNYRLRPVNGEWRVFDVEAEGLGFIANFRTSFNERIARDGLENLIAGLESGDADIIDEVVDSGNEE